MPHLDMHQFICRSDNYGVLVHDHRTGATAAIDAPDAAVIERELQKRGWQLTHIWVTHHHGDHVAGNLALKSLAFGGVFVGGGIAPKILWKLCDGSFVRGFVDKGRLSELMRSIRVGVVLNPHLPLIGAAWVAGTLAETLR